MWCVKVDDGGAFQHAIDRPTDPSQRRRAAFSFTHWRRIDPDAAAQFTPPRSEDSLRLQVEFIAATGLDLGARLAASMNQARQSYGGTEPCESPSISVTTARPR